MKSLSIKYFVNSWDKTPSKGEHPKSPQISLVFLVTDKLVFPGLNCLKAA